MFRSSVACMFAMSVLLGSHHVDAADGFTWGAFPRPDLKVEPMGESPCRTRFFSFKIVNVGKMPAGAFAVRIVSGGRRADQTVAGLAVGQSWSYSGPANDLTRASFAVADSTNRIDESDEKNNAITYAGCY